MADQQNKWRGIGGRAGIFCIVCLMAAAWGLPGANGYEAQSVLDKIGLDKGICVVLGLPAEVEPNVLLQLANDSHLLIYFQSPSEGQVMAVRKAAERAGLLGNRIFVSRGEFTRIHLADNLAGAVIAEEGKVTAAEASRVLHPGGLALLGEKQIVKPVPEGVDDWSHPYHGPDNNPQSTDRLALAPYLTQFLADPKFCPMPEISVAAGGRVYRAFGHIAHKANQNAMLNKLICVNAYNGTLLWQRDLKEGFMIHRNTMIATPDTLYMADDKSCKLIDAKTGKIRDEITIPKNLADGTVWKWMAMEDGVLYALIGSQEVPINTQPSRTPGMGHWPWGMWEGHDYSDPKTSFGFGRTLVAIDAETKKVLWDHRDDDYLDSRGVCLKNGALYAYCPEKFLTCLDAKTGKVRWKTSEEDLLEAIGPNERAQHYVTGYSTTAYIKCNDDMVFFAGPQRSRLVVIRAEDGKLLWQKQGGNYQLVLRDDGLFAAGPQQTGAKFDYATGNVLAQLPRRRACTRATGTLDSIFYRTPGGTVRIETATNAAYHIAPMRPPCQDGVIVSDGHLYWGPWMCGCQLSFYGHVCLAPGGDFDYQPAADASRLEPGEGDTASVKAFRVRPGDWPCYRGNTAQTGVTRVALEEKVERQWAFKPVASAMPTAPVAAGDMIFVADRNGIVRALGTDGQLRWKAYTDGPVYFPPAVDSDRVFVGSADGKVYAFEAATGRRLWSFRLAPAQRRIPVYGKLISTWPVAGGVVVHNGVVYAAAGMAHYDGTHVAALDAVTGEVKWYNNSSGTLSEKVNSGISLQGPLSLRGGELQFQGGGIYRAARYDPNTGKCLNEPFHGVTSQFATAFYPYYPTYAEYQSFHHRFDNGNVLAYNAKYDASNHSVLRLLGPARAAANPRRTDAPARRVTDRAAPAPRRTDRARPAPVENVLWSAAQGRRYNSLVLTPGTLLAAGQAGPNAFLAGVSVADGTDTWLKPLPVAAVKGGTAVDREGRIIVSLNDGRVLCYQ